MLKGVKCSPQPFPALLAGLMAVLLYLESALDGGLLCSWRGFVWVCARALQLCDVELSQS